MRSWRGLGERYSRTRALARFLLGFVAIYAVITIVINVIFLFVPAKIESVEFLPSKSTFVEPAGTTTTTTTRVPAPSISDVYDLTWPVVDHNPTTKLCDELRARKDPFLSDVTLSMCESITAFFRTREDKIHAVGVVQGETDGRGCLANDERWGHLKGGRPQGCWSFMTYLRWPQRYGMPWIDVYDINQASLMASVLVYDRPTSHLGFHHWWSVHYGALNRFLIRWGVRPIYYCPPDSGYWLNVPEGSGVAARKACT